MNRPHQSRGPHKSILRSMRIEPGTAWSWAALMAAALAGFRITQGTQYHQFALGVLLSSVSLLVLLFLVEVIWQAVAAALARERRG